MKLATMIIMTLLAIILTIIAIVMTIVYLRYDLAFAAGIMCKLCYIMIRNQTLAAPHIRNKYPY